MTADLCGRCLTADLSGRFLTADLSGRCLTSCYWMRTGAWTLGPGCGCPAPPFSSSSSTATVLLSLVARPTQTATTSGAFFFQLFSCEKMPSTSRIPVKILKIYLPVTMRNAGDVRYTSQLYGKKTLWKLSWVLAFLVLRITVISLRIQV